MPCRSGQHWTRDGIEFHVLHPPPGSNFDGNDRSCVVLIEAGQYRVLLSGDIEQPAEHRLVRDGLLPPVDVVLVPHHGSRTSSSKPFVHALSPSVAIVSAAFGNHWGFPKEDIVARWEAVGARVLSTATSGAIGLRMCADSGIVSITQYRVDNRRIWHE
jgi:competence protein ComEC